MALVKWILLLVVVIGLSVLFAENSHETLTLKFFGRVFLNIPFYYVVGAALLVGALLTLLLNLVREVQLRGRIRGLNRDLRDRDREIAELRSLPLSDLDGDPEGS